MGLGNMFFSLLTPNVRCKHTPPSPLNRWDEPQREAPHPYTPPPSPLLLASASFPPPSHPRHPLVQFQGHCHRLRPIGLPPPAPATWGSRELTALPPPTRPPGTPQELPSLRVQPWKGPKWVVWAAATRPEPTLMMSRPGCGYSRTGSCSSMFIKPISSGSAPWLTK